MKCPIVVSLAKNRGSRKIGYVVKASNKTLKVNTQTRVKHKITGKYNNVKCNYTVHDEYEEARVGDTVTFAYYRPISKTKSQVLIKIHKTNDLSKN
jgi:small subunit ribosomal protein S17